MLTLAGEGERFFVLIGSRCRVKGALHFLPHEPKKFKNPNSSVQREHIVAPRCAFSESPTVYKMFVYF